MLDAHLEGGRSIAWPGWKGFTLAIVADVICDVPLVAWRRLICDLLIQTQKSSSARLLSTEDVLTVAVRAAAYQHKHTFGYAPGIRNLNRLGTVALAVRASPRQARIVLSESYGDSQGDDFVFMGIRRGPQAKASSWRLPPKNKRERGKRAAWLPVLRTWPEHFDPQSYWRRRTTGVYGHKPWIRDSLLRWIQHYRRDLLVLPLTGAKKTDADLCVDTLEPLEQPCDQRWMYRCLRHSKDFCEKHAWWHLQHNNCRSYMVRRDHLEADIKLVREAHPDRSLDNA